jgi:hypothetical protein
MSQEEKSALLKLPKQCIQALDYGISCDSSQPVQKWYFDIDMKLCYPFEFAGCDSHSSNQNVHNRFSSTEECNQLCMENFQKIFKPVEESVSASTSKPVHSTEQHHNEQHDHQSYQYHPTTHAAKTVEGRFFIFFNIYLFLIYYQLK